MKLEEIIPALRSFDWITAIEYFAFFGFKKYIRSVGLSITWRIREMSIADTSGYSVIFT